MDNNSETNNEEIIKEIDLINKMNNGLNWFYWIAALSIINSILFILNSDVSFLAGLGITQIINIFIGAFPGSKVIGIVLNLIFISGFILLGKFSKKSNFLIILGIIIYALDSIIFLIAQDWFSLGFHVFAIFGIVSGYNAKKSLSKLNHHDNIEETKVIDESLENS